MKTLYFECNMGASGDMIVSSLLELLDEPDKFLESLNNFGFENISIKMSKTKKCGITGTNFDVIIDGHIEESCDIEHSHHHHVHEHHHEHEHHEHHHNHTGFEDITKIINSLNVNEKVKNNAIGIYNLILEAEADSHGVKPDMVHFHEVGHLDAVVDIVTACLLFDKINPDKIITSPINTGSGFIKCSHGILPVPAPATAFILKGVPIFSNNIKSELCTPTGAAILKYFSDGFKTMPPISIQKTGYGMGKKDFEAANMLRVFLGESDEGIGKIVELTCNIDDMTGEHFGFACKKLFEEGALDVYIIPAYMKKGRPGHLLTCLCSPDKSDVMIEAIFKHTTTFGIRKNTLDKYMLNRSHETASGKFGDVHIKNGSGFGVSKTKIEYEDAAKLADKNDTAINTIYKSIDSPPQ